MSKLILFLSFVLSVIGSGAPCCGGTSNVPSLISGDHQAQLSATFSRAAVVAEALVNGQTRYRHDDSEQSLGLRLDGALLISDRWQLGFTLPFTQRSRSRGLVEASASGLSDSAINLGYEILPEWDYSSWKPRGWFFLTTTLPTGRSLYDSTELYRIDSRGRGFYALSLGALFTKTWGNFDVSFLAEGHRAFSRTLTNQSGTLELNPGWGASGSLAGGYSPGGGAIRVGLALNPSFEEGVATSGILTSEAPGLSLWSLSSQLSYLPSDDLSVSLTYTDQTLLGGSSNASLNRIFAVLVQKRWDR